MIKEPPGPVEVCRLLDRYVRSRQYAGYSKFDALNSPFLEKLSEKSVFLRLLFSQVVNRIPLPLREIFGVRKLRNPKGIANFIRGYCTLVLAKHPLADELGARAAIRDLADWLLANDSATHGQYDGPGRAWGYAFPWQSPGFYARRYFPNCIVTTFCAEAFLDAFLVTQDPRYLEAALGASRYILECLPVLESTQDTLCIGYVHCELKWKVINVNSVAAGFLSRLSTQTGDPKTRESAAKMIRWVLSARTPDSVLWDYTWPKTQGLGALGPDNYHTGGILDGTLDYMEQTGDAFPKDECLKALRFYEKSFFTKDHAPKWRLNRNYPFDVHGSAQGILTFSKASRLDPLFFETAKKIERWASRELRDPQTGRFYYQKWGFFTWKIDLMRWNNSWMFRALAELIRSGGA